MTWPYRTKGGDDPGPIAKAERPIEKKRYVDPPKSSYLHTLEAFLNERMRHVMRGAKVTVHPKTNDEVIISYFIPEIVLKASRDNAGRMLEAIAGNTPETGVDAIEKTTVRRRKMAIARFRLGKFGRP